MQRTILIISSDFTGHGHKSITSSLKEQFSNYPVKVYVVDGFSLGGNFTEKVGKMYGSVTRNAKDIWRIIWDISLKKPELICEMTEFTIRDSFLQLLGKIKPDLILSVHPNFNGSVLNILEEYDIKIPFCTLIADLVSITPLWADPRVDFIICPTLESKLKCLEFGIPENKLKVIGFPVRSKFTNHLKHIKNNRNYDINRPLECLIMSGGEGSGNMSRVARILLKNFNCRVKIISGRNKILKRRLEYTLKEKYPGKVEIYGFVDNIQELMLSSDIAFTRGSPNVMMEAIMCNTPLIVTGALPGQEEGNPGYIEKYNLGVICSDLRELKTILHDLLNINATKLNQIMESQRNFTNPNIAKEIVDFVLSIENESEIRLPEIQKKYLYLNKMFAKTGLKILERQKH